MCIGHQPINLFLIVIYLVVARTAALPVSPIALYARDALGREHTVELRVLIGRSNIVILPFEQFRQVCISLACIAFVYVVYDAQHQRPLFATRGAAVIEQVEHIVPVVFLGQTSCHTAEHIVLLIVEHEARSGRHSRRSAHHDGIRLVYLLPQQLNLFF